MVTLIPFPRFSQQRVQPCHIARPVTVHGIGSGTYLSQKPGNHDAFSLYDVAPGKITRVHRTWDGARFVAEPAAPIGVAS